MKPISLIDYVPINVMFDKSHTTKDYILKANYEAFYTLKKRQCSGVILQKVRLIDNSIAFLPTIIISPMFSSSSSSSLVKLELVDTDLIASHILERIGGSTYIRNIEHYRTNYKLNDREFKKYCTKYLNETSLILTNIKDNSTMFIREVVGDSIYAKVPKQKSILELDIKQLDLKSMKLCRVTLN